MRWLVIFFVVTPMVEMYLLIEVGGYIGAAWTIALVMGTAVIGVALLRRQGVSTLTRALARMQRGEVPAQEMAEGLLLAVAGALLLTPGFVTDGIGFALLVPVVRRVLIRRMLDRVEVVDLGPGPTHGSGPRNGGSRSGTTIEGDFEPRP